jgi:integrase
MSDIQPIKSLEKISNMRKILRGNTFGLRDELLFVLGINTGFRISDLLSLKILDVWSDGKPKEEIRLVEKKTGKSRVVPINSVVIKLLKEYMIWRAEKYLEIVGEAPLFPSRKGNGPLERRWASKILKKAAKAVGISNVATHTLRKTFGYHAYKETGNNLGLVQKLLNHSRADTTLRYIGITKDEMNSVFLKLNLG